MAEITSMEAKAFVSTLMKSGARIEVAAPVGCNYGACRKVCDAGQTLCPHHILVVAHEKEQALEKEKAKRLENERRMRAGARR